MPASWSMVSITQEKDPINALMAVRMRPPGDIPLTSRINNYSWGKYSIFDTPGVDAPKAHEEVTKEQMLKACGHLCCESIGNGGRRKNAECLGRYFGRAQTGFHGI